MSFRTIIDGTTKANMLINTDKFAFDLNEMRSLIRRDRTT